MESKVTAYIAKQTNWKKELEKLRSILLDLPLVETVKWGAPYYTDKGKNIVGMAAFKHHFGLWFTQGALLQDKHGKLMNAQEGKTNALRQWRCVSMDDIDEELIRVYVLEAIDNQRNGKAIKPQRKPLVIPDLLQNALDSNSELKEKYENFSLSHKREYADYISEAKREATKLSRLEKIVPMILESVGLHDKYRNC
ncbi:YdeI/OmpD-associated family protein [Flavobacteriaceae bacterium S356]|uniref:YdeI/OmpD-associated family protein n=1 Tax=Asprobacillus argus TaxID=3076534 RepID=A0ABU3LDV0_9FLAO|nr:YdeI/OmpD-associated family protein [Flavobacteriaceae bacterium S356]